MPAVSRLERSYRVRFDEAGVDGHLRSSGFLRFAHDLAWIHSESVGFGRDWYARRGLTWLARCVELEVLADAEYGAELDVTTEVIGFRRVWARRRTAFERRGSRRPLAVAITDWVLLNARGRPAQLPAEVVSAFPSGVESFTPLRLELPPTAQGATRREFSPRLAELDPMGHVNNAAYLDYVDDHLAATGRRGELRRRPRRYRGEFIASAEAGTALAGLGWDADLGWCYRLLAGERELFRARFESDPALWVGG